MSRNPYYPQSSSAYPQNTPNYPEQPPNYTEADAEVLLGRYPPPPRVVDRLSLPVALPQIAGTYDASFLRAYNRYLEHSGVNQEDWLRFLDGLNVAIVSPIACAKPFPRRDIDLWK